MAQTVRVHNAAGTLVLDLSANGYEVVAVVPAGRSWRRMVTTSPYVDGALETGAVLDTSTVELTLRCVGADWTEVDALYVALLDAVEVPSWLLVVTIDGFTSTYRARAADSTSTLSTAEVNNAFRAVSLSIPVQPLEV